MCGALKGLSTCGFQLGGENEDYRSGNQREDGVGFLDGPGASPGGIKEIQSKPANLRQGEVGSEQAV